MKPIGTIHSPFKEKFGIPRQPGLAPTVVSSIRLQPELSESLRGLEGFSHLWVIFLFHAVPDAEVGQTVRPPRLGGNRRVGVLASRSPFRPNRIGLSLVAVERIDPARTQIDVRGADLLDGTPVLDVKPYLPYADAPAGPVTSGWLDDAQPIPQVAVHVAPDAARAIAAFEAEGYPALGTAIREILTLDPRPATRGGHGPDAGRYGARLFDFDVRWRVRDDGSCEVIEVVDLRSS